MEILSGVMAGLSAILGAGFASGREIYSFFTRWGLWSWSVILVCGLWMGLLAWLWMGGMSLHKGRGLFLLLMGMTAGGMTAAAGELVRLVWPWHGGWTWGVCLTLAAALGACRRGIGALKSIGWLLLPGILLLFFTTNQAPAWEGVQAGEEPSPRMWWDCLAYGAMNITLAAPVWKQTKNRPVVATVLAAALMGLLGLGNGVLLKHPELAQSQLPMMQLLRTQGKFGFALGLAVMYLAVFSTLVTALLGLHQVLNPRTPAGWLWMGAAVLLVALAGFQSLIEQAYPILGRLCMGWAGWAWLKPRWIRDRTRSRG